ncbi:hypothetical protein BU26DRAFT_563333 [Trematosphaeria pertusa]|uniref:Uncharacterized protein n=1 Tax=Trematosphaeria pertusa TaxID=390896 RepID=A0A6A6ILA2_9PLEO|nr:uncharacterized protein BU26DRAFT_563333 [Trematosphaeria pertusa]KAF2251394.1 hypothetical protein BU26DRAFT_563333 [Trematosphaeria pertusa]
MHAILLLTLLSTFAAAAPVTPPHDPLSQLTTSGIQPTTPASATSVFVVPRIPATMLPKPPRASTHPPRLATLHVCNKPAFQPPCFTLQILEATCLNLPMLSSTMSMRPRGLYDCYLYQNEGCRDVLDTGAPLPVRAGLTELGNWRGKVRSVKCGVGRIY